VVKALFDTNILIDFLQGEPETREEFARYDDLAISIVSWMEVMVGATEATSTATRAFLSRFEVVGIDMSVAETAVELRQAHRIKLPDAIIWATARRRNRLLVTRNTRDFPSTDPGIRMPYGRTPPP